MNRIYACTLTIALALALSTVPLLAQSNTTRSATPPPNFKKVSSIVNLPDWLPGLGTLYIDPATAPVGPYLGYNHNGRLVNVIYMVSIKDFDQHKDLNDLGQKVARMGLKVNHTSVDYNPGHPGMQEPHYHVIEWHNARTAAKRTEIGVGGGSATATSLGRAAMLYAAKGSRRYASETNNLGLCVAGITPQKSRSLAPPGEGGSDESTHCSAFEPVPMSASVAVSQTKPQAPVLILQVHITPANQSRLMTGMRMAPRQCI